MQALERGEPEGLVFEDGESQAAAELLALRGRLRANQFAVLELVGERVGGVETLVAEEAE